MRNKVERDEFYIQNYVEEDEIDIDLYKLFDIFKKNIKTFVIVSSIALIITFIYVGKKILFDKNNKIYINYTLNYEEINSYMREKIYYSKNNPMGILLNDKYIELLFENSDLKSLFEEKVKENRDSINVKRKFLVDNKILEVSSLRDLAKSPEEKNLISVDSFRTTVKVNKRNDKNREVSNSIMASYLKVMEQYYNENMFDYLIKRKEYLEKLIPALKNQLEENAISNKALVPSDDMGNTNYLKYIYPIEISNIDSYYGEYMRIKNEYEFIKKVFELELNKMENFIKYDTSIITENEKSGNLTKLGIGIFISLTLGLVSIFIKYFVDEYKKRQEIID